VQHLDEALRQAVLEESGSATYIADVSRVRNSSADSRHEPRRLQLALERQERVLLPSSSSGR
jgi:hypothetical protein